MSNHLRGSSGFKQSPVFALINCENGSVLPEDERIHE